MAKKAKKSTRKAFKKPTSIRKTKKSIKKMGFEFNIPKKNLPMETTTLKVEIATASLVLS